MLHKRQNRKKELIMDTRALMIYAADLAPRVLNIPRKTWYWIIGILILSFALILWALIASAHWLFQQGRDVATGVANNAPAVTQTVIGQVNEIAPGAKEAIDGVMGALSLGAPEQREVSGNDIAPVGRYTGMTRVAWDQNGIVEYEGKAQFKEVRTHYSSSFSQLGFTENSVSATQETEVHEYRQNDQRFIVTTTQKSSDLIHVRIEKAKG
jgi:hypothetical protein